jgi:hypothetical protein
MKPKVYDFLEAQVAKQPLKPRDLILYPNGGVANYPDFATFEAWMDKNFEYVVEKNGPSYPVWMYRITGVLKNISK